jgi:hypothetical protein
MAYGLNSEPREKCFPEGRHDGSGGGIEQCGVKNWRCFIGTEENMSRRMVGQIGEKHGFHV